MPPRGARDGAVAAAAGGVRRRRRDAPRRPRRGSSDSEDEVEHYQEDPPIHHLPTLPAAPQPEFKTYLGSNYAHLPLMRRLNWLHVPLLTLTPIIALYGLLTTPWMWQTVTWSVVYYFFTGLGITAGYHRLWSHKAYKAARPTEVALMLAGSGAVEGSIRWWCRDHRAHHRYVDTPKDPYAVTNGFFYAHIGWMLVKQDKANIGRADISDLNADPMIRFQHKWYVFFALAMGFIVPSVVAGIGWGDYRGGFFLAGVARLVFVHHSTFFVNSLAHYWGDQTYSDGHTAKNSVITALLTLGEGYHNFHHEFPSDYRNGLAYYHYDPTKWLIRGLSWLKQTFKLRRFPMNEIRKGEIQMRQRALDGDAAALNWGPKEEELEPMTRAYVKAEVATGAQLVMLDGYVLDVGHFRERHPGGVLFIANNLGEDISEKIRGATYKHSNAAHNLSQTFRVGRLIDEAGAPIAPATTAPASAAEHDD